MGISLNDLPPAMREQALAKFAIAEANRRKDAKAASGNKYHAKKVQGCLIDGTPHTFDSVKEADRYAELAMMQRAGKIGDLQVQVPFELVPKQKKSDGKTERAVFYIADFVYKQDGETVVEDVKGYRDPSSAAYAKFGIKRKLMLWIHGIEVHEI